MNFMADQFAIDLRKLAARVDLAIGLTAKKLEVPKINDPIPRSANQVEEPPARADFGDHLFPKKTIQHLPISQGSLAKTNGDAQGPINKSQIKILKALSDLQAVGFDSPVKSQVAFWSRASVTSSTFANNVSNLKTRGMITYPSPGSIALDPSVLPQFPPEGLTKAVVGDCARELLNATQNRMMGSIRVAYPKELSKEQLAAEIGASFTSSTFANNVSQLKTAGLISYPRWGFVRMADWLDV